MNKKTKPTFTLRVGAEVYLFGANPWVIRSCNFKEGTIIVASAQESCEVSFTLVKHKNGAKLFPFSKYKLEYGLDENKYTVYFRYVSAIPERGVLLIGAEQYRKLAGVELPSYKLFIPTNSPAAFDEPPPKVCFKVGHQLSVRTDHAKWFEDGAVEFNGKTGILDRINWQGLYHNATFCVQFGNNSRTYKIIRFIDSNGNYLVFGWHYKVHVTKDSFEAIPIRRLPDNDKLSWHG